MVIFLNPLFQHFWNSVGRYVPITSQVGDGQGGEPNLIYATQALYRVSDAAWNLLDPALAHHLPSETLVKKSLPELPQVSEYGGKLFGSTKNDRQAYRWVGLDPKKEVPSFCSPESS